MLTLVFHTLMQDLMACSDVRVCILTLEACVYLYFCLNPNVEIFLRGNVELALYG